MMNMVSNNFNDALENLLLGDVNGVKVNVDATHDATFIMNEEDGSITLQFDEKNKNENGFIINKPKVHHLVKDEELMDGNTVQDDINYIIEQMMDFLNKDFGIIPLGTQRWKASNAYEF